MLTAISWDFCKMLIPKFHPFLHILIKPVWFVAWASGLELPRWRACERLWKEMRTFHSRELKGPLQSKVLRCSNRPRGKGHLPTLAPCQFSHLSFLSCHVVSVKSYFPHLGNGCMHVLSHVWLFMTPSTVAHQAPLPMEFSRQEYWNGLFPSPGDLPDPGIELHISCIGRQLFPTSALLLPFLTLKLFRSNFLHLSSIHSFQSSLLFISN